jgi:dTDP-4-amino-4,6-dideoxygalactose transaminase
LKKVASNNERRRALTALYRDLLSELAPALHMPFEEVRGTSCYHILPVLLPAGADRIRFMEGMKAQGVQTSIHYPPAHRFCIYQKRGAGNRNALPLTEQASAREVTLPLFPTMREEQVEWVARAAGEVLKADATQGGMRDTGTAPRRTAKLQ